MKCPACGSEVAADAPECPDCHLGFALPEPADAAFQDEDREHEELDGYAEVARGTAAGLEDFRRELLDRGFSPRLLSAEFGWVPDADLARLSGVEEAQPRPPGWAGTVTPVRPKQSRRFAPHWPRSDYLMVPVAEREAALAALREMVRGPSHLSPDQSVPPVEEEAPAQPAPPDASSPGWLEGGQGGGRLPVWAEASDSEGEAAEPQASETAEGQEEEVAASEPARPRGTPDDDNPDRIF